MITALRILVNPNGTHRLQAHTPPGGIAEDGSVHINNGPGQWFDVPVHDIWHTGPDGDVVTDDAPLECVKCGSAIGPVRPINADHAGWMCPKCYQQTEAVAPEHRPLNLPADRSKRIERALAADDGFISAGNEPERCGFIPTTPGYAPCTRTKGHDGPCAHPESSAAVDAFKSKHAFLRRRRTLQQRSLNPENVCECGHSYSRHDPAYGTCNAHAVHGVGVCPCGRVE